MVVNKKTLLYIAKYILFFAADISEIVGCEKHIHYNDLW